MKRSKSMGTKHSHNKAVCKVCNNPVSRRNSRSLQGETVCKSHDLHEIN